MRSDERIDGGLEFFIIKTVRKRAFDRAFAVVFDAHAVTKSDEKFLLPLHEVNLKEMLADGVAGFKFQSFVKPGNLICDRFFLDENGAELPVCGECGDRRFIKLTVIFPDPEKHVADERRVDFLIDFECFHSLFCLGGVNTA